MQEQKESYNAILADLRLSIQKMVEKSISSLSFLQQDVITLKSDVEKLSFTQSEMLDHMVSTQKEKRQDQKKRMIQGLAPFFRKNVTDSLEDKIVQNK